MPSFEDIPRHEKSREEKIQEELAQRPWSRSEPERAESYDPYIEINGMEFILEEIVPDFKKGNYVIAEMILVYDFPYPEMLIAKDPDTSIEEMLEHIHGDIQLVGTMELKDKTLFVHDKSKEYGISEIHVARLTGNLFHGAAMYAEHDHIVEDVRITYDSGRRDEHWICVGSWREVSDKEIERRGKWGYRIKE